MNASLRPAMTVSEKSRSDSGQEVGLTRPNPNPSPGCGGAEETVHHFLMMRPKYQRLRDGMRKEVGVGGMKMEKLLGDSRRIKDMVKFIESTDRFDF